MKPLVVLFNNIIDDFAYVVKKGEVTLCSIETPIVHCEKLPEDYGKSITMELNVNSFKNGYKTDKNTYKLPQRDLVALVIYNDDLLFVTDLSVNLYNSILKSSQCSGKQEYQYDVIAPFITDKPEEHFNVKHGSIVEVTVPEDFRRLAPELRPMDADVDYYDPLYEDEIAELAEFNNKINNKKELNSVNKSDISEVINTFKNTVLKEEHKGLWVTLYERGYLLGIIQDWVSEELDK